MLTQHPVGADVVTGEDPMLGSHEECSRPGWMLVPNRVSMAFQ